jgi:hypothetical protein
MKDVQIAAQRQIAHIDKLLLHGVAVSSPAPTI